MDEGLNRDTKSIDPNMSTVTAVFGHCSLCAFSPILHKAIDWIMNTLLTTDWPNSPAFSYQFSWKILTD